MPKELCSFSRRETSINHCSLQAQTLHAQYITSLEFVLVLSVMSLLYFAAADHEAPTRDIDITLNRRIYIHSWFSASEKIRLARTSMYRL